MKKEMRRATIAINMSEGMTSLPGTPQHQPALSRRINSDSELTARLLSTNMISPGMPGGSRASYMVRKGSDLGEVTADSLPETLPLLQTCVRKWADMVLLFAIVVSVLLVVLSTLDSLEVYHQIFDTADMCFISLFAIEFVMRLWFAEDKWEYLSSLFGVIDMLSCLPVLAFQMLSLVLPIRVKADPHYVEFSIMLQLLRTFRVFRVMKLGRYVQESYDMLFALESPRSLVFMFGFSVVSLLLSAVMYAIEGNTGNESFSSIPHCLYWTVVTISTVGYGDVTPSTALGKAFAIFVIIIGYGAIVAQGIHIDEGGVPMLGILDRRRSSTESLDGNQRRRGHSSQSEPDAKMSSLLDTLKEDCMSLSDADRAKLLAFLAERLSNDICNRRLTGGNMGSRPSLIRVQE